MSGLIDLGGWSRTISAWVSGILAWIADTLGNYIPIFRDLANWFRSDAVVEFWGLLIATIIMLVFAVINLLIVLWMERKLYGRLQDRRGVMIPVPWKKKQKGTGFLQNIADGIKLFQKENITPRSGDSAMFHAAPAIVFISSIMAYAAIPLSTTFVLANLELGLIFIVAMFALAPLAVLIAGWASNNKYTLIGGMRGAAQMLAYEVPLILCVVGVAILAGTLNPIELVSAQQKTSILGIENWYFIPQFIGFIVFMVAILAELERLPFDIPEAESELVEGWLTEISGIRFGLIFMSKWIKGWAAAALTVLLFFGGWSGPVLPQEIWFLLKTYLLFAFFVWITWALPRVRIDQILKIGWYELVPLSFASIFIAVALKILSHVGLGWF
ncbi:MAG: NADH-quinone oxidoreductase subunit NuoH [Thermoplasmata archaeon]